MGKKYELMEDVAELPEDKLRDYIVERAIEIVRNTQGESWDDPEEWQLEAAELAHAALRMLGKGEELEDEYSDEDDPDL